MQSKNKIILLFLILCVFTSCGLNKAVYDPYSFAPDKPYDTYQPLETAVSTKTLDSFFPADKKNEKLTLAELINIALFNNPSTKKTWADAMAAASVYGKSMKDYLPQIDGFLSCERIRQTYLNESLPMQHPANQLAYYQTTTTPEMQFTYTIFDFGKRKYATEKARQALYYADWMHNEEIQSVMQQVMTSYYDYQYQCQYLLSLEENLKNTQMSLEAAQEKFRVGVVSLGDVIQAKTSFLQTKMDIATQKQAKEASFANLANALGLPSNQIFYLQDFPEDVTTFSLLEKVDQLIAKAKSKRQDFLAMQANVKAQEASIQQAKSNFLPSVDFAFDIGKNYYNKYETEDYHFTALFKLSIPIFYGFSLRNAVRQAEAELKKAKALAFEKSLQITKDVTIAYNDMQNAAETVNYSKEYLLSAEKQFTIALANYKAGTGNILDITQAQAFLADARAKKAKSQQSWYNSIASLAYATGSLGAQNEEKEIQKL